MVMKYACVLFICKNTLINPNAISILTLSECIFTNKLSLLTHVSPFASNTHTHTLTGWLAHRPVQGGGVILLCICALLISFISRKFRNHAQKKKLPSQQQMEVWQRWIHSWESCSFIHMVYCDVNTSTISVSSWWTGWSWAIPKYFSELHSKHTQTEQQLWPYLPITFTHASILRWQQQQTESVGMWEGELFSFAHFKPAVTSRCTWS